VGWHLTPRLLCFLHCIPKHTISIFTVILSLDPLDPSWAFQQPSKGFLLVITV
jgi:hypothetical protein